jgi:RHS repeat-associated protein
MIRSIRLVSLLLLLTFTLVPIHAQVTTGIPPFGSFGGGPDVINLGNLNAHLDIPVLNKPGRGTNFTYDLTYDSSVWYPVTSGSTTSWQPVGSWGWSSNSALSSGNTGYITYKMTQTICRVLQEGHYLLGTDTVYSNTIFYDQWGTAHLFGGTYTVLAGSCGNSRTSTYPSLAWDNSGLIAQSYGGCITTAKGGTFCPPANPTGGSYSATYKDRNGNEITANTSGQFFDTLSSSTAVLTVGGAGTPSSPMTFTYTPPGGGSAAYTVKYTTFDLETNFGCNGIAEYGANGTTTANLVTEIDLPDQVSKYMFTYEKTVGHTGYVTGRLASITLPTGATISYTYGNNVNGITCADGSASTLTRTTPDGTWTYARTMGTGAASATLITAPQLSYDSAANQTIAQFQGIYPTQSDTYQGSAPSFTTLPINESTLQTSNLLQEVQTCYNASASPCPGTAITTLPIQGRTVITSVAGPGKLWSEHEDGYNTNGLQTLSEDFDFSPSPPGTLLQQTKISYATLGASLTGFPQTVEVLNTATNIYSRQDTAYDGATLTCVSGAPQHDDTDFPCTFNTRGNATSVTTYTTPSVPSGGITKNFTYDSTGNLLTAQLNCCELKTWVYSTKTSYAYPDSVTSGLSSPQLSTTATYDLNMGLTLTSTDPNGLVTTNTYDNMGRPLTSTVGTNPATTFTYNDFNNSSSFTAWTVQVCAPVQGTNEACQKTIADSQGRVVTSQLLDASNNLYSATDTQYDAWGRAYKVGNPYTTSSAYWTQTNFDALSRAVKTTLQDGSVSTSLYTDNTVTTTDPVGKQRKGVVDGLGRLTSVYEPDPTNGNSLTLQTSYSYNVLNQLTQVTQGSQTRTYAYDALGRLNSASTPEGGTACYGTYSGSTCQANGYDSWNNLLYRTDARGVVTNYLYDTLNRLVGITYPTVPTGVAPMPNVCKANGASNNNANVCFTYGTSAASYNNGLPLTMTDASGSENYSYNSLEQTTQLQKVVSGKTYTTSYAYNLANELTQVTYPSGRVVLQGFDAVGRLCAVGTTGSTCSSGTTYTNGFTYNAAQQPTAFNYGNGVAASFGYSPDRLQLTSLSYGKSGTTLFGLTYSYGSSGSNDGLVSSITDTVQAGRSVSYTYDSLARLSTALTAGSANYPQWGLQWTYDRYANRSAQAVTAGTGAPSNSVTVNSATNQLGSPYAYDASGNMTNDGSNTLVYDGENRATSATNSSTSGTYTYDGRGLRVQKVAGSTTTVYVFSGSKVIAEYDNGVAPTSPSREYVYSGATLLAKFDSTGIHYYHQDLVSNRLVTDSSGNVAEQLGHYPYGELWYNASNDKLFFTTYERDAESGNDYAQARYYVNRLGRFSSTDPLAGTTDDPQSLNRYVYARDLPMMLVDPSGQDDCPQNARRKRKTEEEYYGMGMGLFPSELEEMSPVQSVEGDGCFGGGGDDAPLDGSTGDGYDYGANGLGADDDLPDLPLPQLFSTPMQVTVTATVFDFSTSDALLMIMAADAGDPRQVIINGLRRLLDSLITNDPNCLMFLNGKGANPEALLSSIPINHGNIGGQSVQAQTNNSNPDINSLVPTNPSITINDNGWFFTRGGVAADGTASGTPYFQGGILLHELGHAAGVLLADGEGVPNASANQAINNQAIIQHCAQTLNNLSKK